MYPPSDNHRNWKWNENGWKLPISLSTPAEKKLAVCLLVGIRAILCTSLGFSRCLDGRCQSESCIVGWPCTSRCWEELNSCSCMNHWNHSQEDALQYDDHHGKLEYKNHPSVGGGDSGPSYAWTLASCAMYKAGKGHVNARVQTGHFHLAASQISRSWHEFESPVLLFSKHCHFLAEKPQSPFLSAGLFFSPHVFSIASAFHEGFLELHSGPRSGLSSARPRVQDRCEPVRAQHPPRPGMGSNISNLWNEGGIRSSHGIQDSN